LQRAAGAVGAGICLVFPLCCLGQRVFFLHDGGSSDLNEVIALHGGRDSEARGTVDNYQRLSEADKQHLLNFLRSL
jgi:CxxC motif-containing protein (DUF1111 family)